MKVLHVAPIVEGHGECVSVRTLITRIAGEIAHRPHVNVLRPIRQPRGKLLQEKELHRAVGLGRIALQNVGRPDDERVILVMIDADDDPPCELAPRLLDWARSASAGVDVCCVLPKVEYETWFVAACESLRDFIALGEDEEAPRDPELRRLGKGWIKSHFLGASYSETVEQPRMTAVMDLLACRRGSPSFDKLCREIERRLPAAP